MDVETIKALAELPLYAILIYLIVRQQGQIEKLLTGMIESERKHAENLIALACKFRDPSNDHTAVIADLSNN